MWQTKYASAVPKNLGVGVNFQLCSEGYSSLGVHSPWQETLKEIQHIALALLTLILITRPSLD